MAKGQVQLNGDNGYVLEPFEDGELIRRETIRPFVETFDTEGGETQKRLATFTSKIFTSQHRGIGLERVRSNKANDEESYERSALATMDTRFIGDSYLPILQEDSIEPTTADTEVLRAFAIFKANLWSLWEGSTSTDILARKYVGSSTSWESGGFVSPDTDTTTKVGLDLIAHKQKLIALYAEEDDQLIRHSTDGVTFTAASTQPTAGLLVNSVTANEDIDAGFLVSIGGEAVLAAWDESDLTIEFFSDRGTDGVTWSAEITNSIASGNGPQALVVFPGIDDADKIYMFVREGVWEIDTAPATWTFEFIRPMSSHNDNGRRATVSDDGTLWFSQGVDNDTPPLTYRMTTNEGVRRFEVVPNDLSQGSGLTSTEMGPMRQLVSSEGFVYGISGGGKASRQARVWAHNGFGWHSMRQHGTANQKIEHAIVSSEDDGTPRLHYAIRTSADITDSRFLTQPNTNPRSGVPIKRETSGTIDLPYFDAGMPLIPKTWGQVGINSEDTVGTDDEYFEVTDGRDDGVGGVQARTFNTVGNFFKSTNTVKLGSGAGVSSANYGLRITGHRDTDTKVNVDSVTTNVQSTGVFSSATFAHTCAGANRLLTVLVSAQDNGSTNQIPTGITYAGVSLTKLGDAVTGSNGVGASIWYLVAPATGANNVIVTFASSVNSWVIGAVSVFNNAQTSPVGSMVTDNATGTAPSVTVTASNDDLVIDVLAAMGTSQTATVGAGQTERWNLNLLPLTPARIGAASTEPATGNVTMSWTLGVSDDYVLLGVALKTIGTEINTTTPILKDVEVDYIPDPPEVRRFTFRVDIEKTAALEDTDVETIISRLETAETLPTWPTFSYANMTQTNVDVKPIRWLDKLHNPGGEVSIAPDVDARRVGFADITLEEIIG